MEMAEVVAKDLPDVISAIEELKLKVIDVSQHIGGLLQKVESGSFNVSKGVSFLDVKFHMLLSYLINLVSYILLKTEGRQVEEDSVVERLIEIRTVIEKIRPIDQKMKYQIDKLIKAATLGKPVAGNDPLRFKPNPANMISKLEEHDRASDEEDEQKMEKAAVYVPPKVSAVPYDDDFGGKRRKEEKAKKRALKSSLIQELRDEYSETPQEVKDHEEVKSRTKREQEEREHRTKYEEDNFVRLVTKKRKRGTVQASSSMDELTSFAKLAALTHTGSGEPSEEFTRTKRPTLRNSKFKKWKRKSVGQARKRRGTK